MLLEAERQELAQVGRRMLADGLCVGTAGNLSLRSGDLVAVTPSGIPYDRLDAACRLSNPYLKLSQSAQQIGLDPVTG